ncbi:MAG TPA: tetratricopeptide repeat protein [Kofleriaceae bacterium]
MDGPLAESLITVAEDARSRLRGPESGTARAQLDERYPELLAALEWFAEAGRQGDAYRLASALVPFWISTGRIADGDAWFRRALDRPGGSAVRRTRAIYDHGYLVFWAGQYDLADKRFAEARTLASAANDPTVAALALAGSARVALNTDVDAAVRLLREALAVTDGTADRDGRSSAMHVLGVALQMSGDLAGARDVMAARIALGRELGDDFIVWVESANLSMVERRLGNLTNAEALSREALQIVNSHGDEMAIPWVMNGLAAVLAAKGEHERAATILATAETLLERAGGKWPPDERQQLEATVAILASALTPEALERARGKGAAMTIEDGVVFALGSER